MVDESMPAEIEAESVSAVEDEITDAVTEIEAEVEEAPVEGPVKSQRRSKSAAAAAEPAVEIDAIPPVEEVEPFPSANAIQMRALVYSPRRKNSESVAMLQKRLSDVGYAAARADLRGWFHDNTRAALVKWQTDHGLEVTGECAFDDMRYLFDGTDVQIIA